MASQQNRRWVCFVAGLGPKLRRGGIGSTCSARAALGPCQFMLLTFVLLALSFCLWDCPRGCVYQGAIQQSFSVLRALYVQGLSPFPGAWNGEG